MTRSSGAGTIAWVDTVLPTATVNTLKSFVVNDGYLGAFLA